MADALAIDRVVRQYEESHRAGEQPDAEALADQVPLALRETARRRLGEAAARLQREAVPEGAAPALPGQDTPATRIIPPPSASSPAVPPPASAGVSDPVGNAPAKGDMRATEPLPQRLGAFEVVRELGRGAFGIVYLAKDPRLDREVAIKVPLLDTPKLRQQYIDEARRAAVIERAGIVPIYHVDVTASGAPYVVQKYVDGPNLRQLVRRSGPLHLVQSLMIVRDVARALAEAHRLGLVHRDLKPENILIDAGGHPWIADFGLALREDEQGGRKGEMAGTPMYMAPEQVTGQVPWLDGRADIWAAGILLYELVSGRPPFEASRIEELVEQICHRHPRPMIQRSSAVPPELDAIFQRCCAKDVTARYATADQLADDLNRVIHGLSGVTAGMSPAGTALPFPGSSGWSDRTSDQASSTRSGGSGVKRMLRWAAGAAVVAAVAGAALVAAHRSRETSPIADPSPPVDADAAGASADAAGQLLPQSEIGTAGEAAVAAIAGAADADGRLTPLSGPGPTGDSDPVGADTMPAERGSERPPTAPIPTPPAAAPTLVQVAPDGSAEYRTLAAALQAVADEGTIDVAPGYYSEALVFDKSVTIRGARDPAQVTLVSQQAPVATVDGATVRIERISLRGLGATGISEFNTIDLIAGSLELRECVLSAGTFNCIKAREGTRLSVERCALAAASDSAISSVGAKGLEISDSDFRDCAGAAIEVFQGPASIVGCRVQGTTHYGIYCEHTGPEPVVIRHCHLQGCTQVGVRVADQGRAEVDRTTLVRCRVGVDAFGGTLSLQRVKVQESTSACVSATAGGTVDAVDCELRDSLVGIMTAQATLTMWHSTVAAMGLRGLYAAAGSVIRLQDCQVEDSAEAGLVVEAGTLTVVGGSVTGNGEAGIVVDGADARLHLSDTTVRNNHRIGIRLTDGRAEIRGGTVSEHTIGLLVRQSTPTPTPQPTDQARQGSGQEGLSEEMEPASLRAEGLEVRDNQVGFEFRAGTKGALLACRTTGHPKDRALVIIGTANVTVDEASVFE